MITPSLKAYIEAEILPRYDSHDAAHQRNHADKVIRDSAMLAESLKVDDAGKPINMDMVYAIAAYHDVGLCEGRKTHHLVSGRIIREDMKLREWFTEEEIETMAQAAEDHRASAEHEPRTVYGRIVAEADRDINVDTILRRTIQYGLAHYPEMTPEGHVQRALDHLDEKYSPHGYLKLWIPGSQNEKNLHDLWRLMENPEVIHQKVAAIYKEETQK